MTSVLTESSHALQRRLQQFSSAAVAVQQPSTHGATHGSSVLPAAANQRPGCPFSANQHLLIICTPWLLEWMNVTRCAIPLSPSHGSLKLLYARGAAQFQTVSNVLHILLVIYLCNLLCCLGLSAAANVRRTSPRSAHTGPQCPRANIPLSLALPRLNGLFLALPGTTPSWTAKVILTTC